MPDKAKEWIESLDNEQENEEMDQTHEDILLECGMILS
jgi:hypothetical protein